MINKYLITINIKTLKIYLKMDKIRLFKQLLLAEIRNKSPYSIIQINILMNLWDKMKKL